MRLLLAAAAAGSAAIAVTAAGAGSAAQPGAAAAAESAQHAASRGKVAQAPRGRRGPRGARGLRGTTGAVGIRGPRGLAGVRSTDLLRQTAVVSWQDGSWQGRERAEFWVPGVGGGEVVCRPDTQWIRIRPADGAHDVAMTLVRRQDGETVVRTAKHEAHTGPDFHEGLNRHAGEGTSTGALSGIVASRGDRSLPGGPGAPPTTISLSWHWNFADGAPRCYVSATLLTGSA